MTKNSQYYVKRYYDIIHIYDPIFKANYWYMCIKNFDMAEKTLEKCGIKHEFNRKNAGGFVVLEKGDDEICLIWSRGNNGTIAHECCHAAEYTLEKCGLIITKDTDEVLAYYVEFLYNAIKARFK